MAKKITADLQQSVGDDPSKAPDKWETQNHLDTLIKAHEIVNNPVHMKAVHKLAGRHRKAISGIQDLKNVYNEGMQAKGQTGKFQTAMGAGAPDTDSDGE